MNMKALIDMAFDIGSEIVEANNGYHFRVHLKSGAIVEGMPELPNGSEILVMNNDLSPLTLIPYNHIDFIDIITV